MPIRGRRIDVARWGPGAGWAVFVFGLHKVGAGEGWYLTHSWFQNVTHAASASGVAILLGLVGLELGFRGRRLAGFVVGFTALAAFGWEVVEYLGWLDAYGVYLLFHSVNDAAVDMASNAVGTAAALLVLRSRTTLEFASDSRAGDPDRGAARTDRTRSKPKR